MNSKISLLLLLTHF